MPRAKWSAPKVVVKPVNTWVPLWSGATIANKTLYLVGGRGANVIMTTRDGRAFKKVDSKGPGLRGVFVDGKSMWISGEYGFLAYSANGGRTFTQIDSGTDVVLFALARGADGTLWVAGEQGYLAKVTTEAVTKVRSTLTGPIYALVDTKYGLLMSASSGLFEITSPKPKRLGLKEWIFSTFVTADGTVLCAGIGNKIYRSTDGGKTFTKAKVPGFKPVKLPKARKMVMPDWETPANDLISIAQLPDGRIIVGGDQGVLLGSHDDGARFEVIAQNVTEGMFNVARTFAGSVILGGDHSIVLRVA